MAVSQSHIKIAGWSLAAMLAIATPLVADWEGKSNQPYQDKLAGDMLTVCYGETRVNMRRYSDAECDAMLSNALGEYGRKVAQCVPGLEERPFTWSASTSLAYNIGVGAFCRSTAARRFNAGDWRGGCEAFKMWRFAGGKEVAGLANRRYAAQDGRVPEIALCLRGLP